MSTPVVALVGRPNVGKSSLFNRMVGDRSAIVSDQAGTTRDRHFGRVEWNSRAFWLVDTGGLSESPSQPMDSEIKRQVMQGIEEADLLLFVVDAKAGPHPADEYVLDVLRQTRKPWILVANKVDDPRASDYMEFYRLGAGDPLPVSAANGKSSGDLLDAVVANMPEEIVAEPDALRVAVIGRPNVGKSSLVNRLLGEERLVVSDEAGTTRDAIDTPMRYHDRTIVFVDTAGLRRQSRVTDGVEFYSGLRTRRAVETADICLVMLDAVDGIQQQDLKIASLAWDAGCGVIIVVNKWDLAEKSDKTSAHFQRDAEERASFMRFVPFLFMSAKTGQRATKVRDLILTVADERQKRISTSQVNDQLGQLIARRQPPQAAGREVKLSYATQVSVAPPTFAVFGNHPELVAEHYVRYLHNGFREAWGFTGNPLRILLRSKAA